ncbi:protein of unknown function DUF820 [Rippkaea orientalis PCC 8801]|uniref:Putative restriction endonuclease domain-containing protein n=1 Tax=Rippkaea orientalis (strain PCC 8801 / RF-1) TaxID=41431 RepID=B7K2R1_RIPO1|nr:Uma2 family endonuclease [Rippkaea orientalis]ACK67612.1 protein of unknown function DUF820 [Rippkaea orientalis PCC 8801]
MIPLQTQPMSFEEFLAWYPEDNSRYELIEGVIVEMLPTSPHEDISGFLIAQLNLAILQHQLPYSIPRSCLIKPPSLRSGYQPDVVVLNREMMVNESLWNQASVIQNGQTVPLVIEVVSTNWKDDYGHKLIEYEAMGIGEYWIIDFRALGAVRYLGKPKQPTVTICQMIDNEYQLQKFTKGQYLESRVFRDLQLTTDAIFDAANL